MGSKNNRRWLWYAFDPHKKKVLGWVFGDRKIETVNKLYSKLKNLNIKFFCTDNYAGFKKVIPWKKHIASKKYTQNIERNNLTLRTKIARLQRKTICFSKKISNHDFIISSYLEKH